MKEYDVHLTSQNSGVMVEGNHEEDQINFYNVFIVITQLDYMKYCEVVLFSCKWFDLDSKKRITNKDGYLLSININKCWYENDPFVLSIQAKQVFYQKFHHRHLYTPEMQFVENDEVFDMDGDQVDEETELYNHDRAMQISEDGSLHRDDIAPDVIDCEDVDKANKLIDDDSKEYSDQEGENDIEEEEIGCDDYDTGIKAML